MPSGARRAYEGHPVSCAEQGFEKTGELIYEAFR
jgi:hypothetical protein